MSLVKMYYNIDCLLCRILKVKYINNVRFTHSYGMRSFEVYVFIAIAITPILQDSMCNY